MVWSWEGSNVTPHWGPGHGAGEWDRVRRWHQGRGISSSFRFLAGFVGWEGQSGASEAIGAGYWGASKTETTAQDAIFGGERAGFDGSEAHNQGTLFLYIIDTQHPRSLVRVGCLIVEIVSPAEIPSDP